MYIVKIPSESYPTLRWLSQRGYDGGFSELASLEDEENGVMTFSISEPDAWQFSENVREDEHAFLACNGDRDLGEALVSLLNRIV